MGSKGESAHDMLQKASSHLKVTLPGPALLQTGSWAGPGLGAAVRCGAGRLSSVSTGVFAGEQVADPLGPGILLAAPTALERLNNTYDVTLPSRVSHRI